MIRLEVFNDTIMKSISANQQEILKIFLENGSLSSSFVHEKIVSRGKVVSLVTIKRELSQLKSAELLLSRGAGRGVKYEISSSGRLYTDIDAHQYNLVEPDKRYGQKSFNFDLFDSVGNELFIEENINDMDKATAAYHSRINDTSPAVKEKELERFVIELSWKSSKIEGNTYTLLDTEKLILEGKEAPGHDKKEAQMILNHKEAFKFIRSNAEKFKVLTRSGVEEVHKILVKDLNVNIGLRSKAVGVTGSIYRPLDNSHQILEAVEKLCSAVSKIESSYGKSFLTLLGLSYIQPFEDGNKRTSRLMANAILLAHDCAPLSYRSVDEDAYREAVLVFYELNSCVPFRRIFVEQYKFSAENYLISK